MLRRQARQQWRAQRSAGPAAAPSPAAAPLHYTAHVVTRLLLAVLGLLLAAFTVGWVLALVSFVTTGAVFGWSLPFQAPFWVVVIAMFVIYGMVTGPVRAARHAADRSLHPWPGTLLATLDGLLGFAVVVVLFWYASHHMDEIRAFIEQLRSGAFRLP
jgi:hypothetical protein